MLTTRFHLDEAHLRHYDERLKSWAISQPVKTLPSSLYPWTLTEKAGAVTCWPVGGTELKPTVDFLFAETGPSSGTKGPDNPSTITGVSSITVTRCETAGVDETQYTVNLGGTYYGGTLDVASGVMTVTWVGESVEAFNNTSLVGTNTVAFRFDCSYAHGAMSVTTDELVCNKFVSELGDGDSEHCRFVGSAGYDNMFVRFYISKSRFDVSSAINPASPTDAEWRAAANAWLSSNPVFISYKINNPFAVILTPTQILSLAQTDKYTPRLNTVYTDASAVQVGYVKSPIREEFELQQAIVAQGGNI